MERKLSIEDIRNFLAVSDKQFVKGGIAVKAIHFNRNEDGTVQDIRLSYEELSIDKQLKGEKL